MLECEKCGEELLTWESYWICVCYGCGSRHYVGEDEVIELEPLGDLDAAGRLEEGRRWGGRCPMKQQHPPLGDGCCCSK